MEISFRSWFPRNVWPPPIINYRQFVSSIAAKVTENTVAEATPPASGLLLAAHFVWPLGLCTFCYTPSNTFVFPVYFFWDIKLYVVQMMLNNGMVLSLHCVFLPSTHSSCTQILTRLDIVPLVGQHVIQQLACFRPSCDPAGVPSPPPSPALIVLDSPKGCKCWSIRMNKIFNCESRFIAMIFVKVNY